MNTPRRKRSPQEGKALSYARDRRNDYGENDKSSRKNIRRNKRHPNRADRHRAAQDLVAATGGVDLDRAEAAAETTQRRRSAWDRARRKYRDAPLAQIVRVTLLRRARLGIASAESVEARLARIEETLASRRSLPAYPEPPEAV